MNRLTLRRERSVHLPRAFVRTFFTPEFPERATAAEKYISSFAALHSVRFALKAT